RIANGSGSSEKVGIGIGAYGDVMGGWVRGDMMGFVTAGTTFASYNMGNEFTSGTQIELVETGSGSRVAAYTNTSTESKVYVDGVAQLSNGSVRINFDASFTSMLASGRVPTVTISPNGAWANIYVENIDNTGFTVREANGGTSNTNLTWIAVGKRSGAAVEIPASVLSSEFDVNMDKVMFNENNLNESALPVWSNDGSALRFDPIPQRPINKVEPAHE
ncbi:MAG TPA: hypothetical protein PKD91_16390, partial [Bacteroidia bacterium]|nr:hypothetical protein [Bacteroidia bacterium]